MASKAEVEKSAKPLRLNDFLDVWPGSFPPEAAYWGCHGLLGLVMLVPYLVDVPVILQMLLYTFPTIYIGSHLSLQQREVDPRTGTMKMKPDSFSRNDAFLAPILGSAALLSLYLAYKFLPAFFVNVLLTTYLGVAGGAAIGETMTDIIECRYPNTTSYVVEPPLPHFAARWKDTLRLEVTAARIAGYIVALFITMGWILTGHWLPHNVIAVALCFQGLRLISSGTVCIACILLVGLFFYDIFWVFGTSVMVTVAKTLEAPIKIIFPISMRPWKQSILGLGDVVIPGIFIAMMLRMDHFFFEQKALGAEKEAASALKEKKGEERGNDSESSVEAVYNIHQSFPKTYFWVTLGAYELGLVITGMVMLLSGHAQPALLYLVPCCMIGLFVPALLRDELTQVWTYSEQIPDTPPAEASSEEEGDDATKNPSNVPAAGTDDTDAASKKKD